jgi:putative ATPase
MSADLFHHTMQRHVAQEAPLAHRMRPRTLAETVGQQHIIGPGRLLRRAIEADQLSSLIFFGPPGTGKTTLAMVIANSTRSHFITLNAVLGGVKEIREAIAEANERRLLHNQRTTLFVDEVHRWNKAQQDALLPHVERGTIILIGATTENPWFEVNKALISRSRIFQLLPLTEEELRAVVRQALEDGERGFGRLSITLHPDALDHLVNIANGDARSALNALELAVETTPPDADGRIVIDLPVAEESIQRRAVLYDKDGDAHYDIISAFIKSLRGSDPDAALYWAARMVYAGEDPRFIFRRMGIFAGEDVGMADPQAAVVVESCWALYERLGLPEGQFPLTQAILYLATAPKSNTAFGFFDALGVVREERSGEVPTPLKDGSRDAQGSGHGAGYKYPHSYQNHWVAQQYLPGALQGRVFYQPSDQGYEGGLAAQVARRREEQLAALAALDGEESAEILTTGPASPGRESWLQRTLSTSGAALGQIRDRLFGIARVQRHHLLLDLHADSGLLLWEAVRRAPEGNVWGIVSPGRLAPLQEQAARLAELERPRLLPHLAAVRAAARETGVRFDHILAHNRLTRLADGLAESADWQPLLADGGQVLVAQAIPRDGPRLYALTAWTGLEGLREQVVPLEEALWTARDNPATAWESADLWAQLEAQGWQVTGEVTPLEEQRRLPRELVRSWFAPGHAWARAVREGGVGEADFGRIGQLYESRLANQTVPWVTRIAWLRLTLP